MLSSIERRKRMLLYSMASSHDHDDASFIAVMTRVITETFYRLVSFALSARHQLLFSFYLACKIQMREETGCEVGDDDNALCVEDYNALLGYGNENKNTNIFADKFQGKFCWTVTITFLFLFCFVLVYCYKILDSGTFHSKSQRLRF